MARTNNEKGRSALFALLRDRRDEIEQETLTRLHAISDPALAPDPSYAESLRAAVSTAIDFGMVALERGEDSAPPIPTSLLAQARIAARNGFSLDTVLRRYFAGYALLGDHLIEAADQLGLHGPVLQRLLRSHAALLDYLLASISHEYSQEQKSRSTAMAPRLGRKIKRLIDGELLDVPGLSADLGYEFEVNHVALVAIGHQAATAVVYSLARALNCRHLVIPCEEDTVWAWLGSHRKLDSEEVKSLVDRESPILTIGEPGKGLLGWRLTHQQAKAALPIAMYGGRRPTRYAEVALLASMLKDDLLVRSLRSLYIVPLENTRDSGETARRTLCAYFAADRNISSTAAAMGMSRNAIANRLRTIEEILGVPLAARSLDLEAALRLDALGSGTYG